MLLHEQLINLSAADFDDVPSPPTPTTARSPRPQRSIVTNHHLEFTDDKQASGKMRYRVCKVCSLRQSDRNQTIGRSRAYCVECSTEKSRVYLCDRIRGSEDGNHMTCFQIWHQLWQNGTACDGDKRIRMRATAPAPDTTSVRSFVSLHTSQLHASEVSFDFAT